MNIESEEFLEDLLKACGPSGFEEWSTGIWYRRTDRYADTMERDVMGNTIATLNPGLPFKVMIAGHCDEIGFIVTNITDEGFLYVEPIGGIDKKVVPGSQVIILAGDKHINGVIGKQAIHLEESDNRDRPEKIKDLFIDIGADNKVHASSIIPIGSPVTFKPNYLRLCGDNFSSKGCDDKVGAFVASEVIKILSQNKSKLKVQVNAVATVQEEVGLRGAVTSAYGVNPDVGFAVDVGWASDVPYANKNEIGDVRLGGGGVIHPGPATNKKLYNLVKDTAKALTIPYQVQASGYPDGTDTSAIQLARAGAATCLISIPNRYMHTQVETCSKYDLEMTAQLIAETILRINPDMDFIPR